MRIKPSTMTYIHIHIHSHMKRSNMMKTYNTKIGVYALTYNNSIRIVNIQTYIHILIRTHTKRREKRRVMEVIVYVRVNLKDKVLECGDVIVCVYVCMYVVLLIHLLTYSLTHSLTHSQSINQ